MNQAFDLCLKRDDTTTSTPPKKCHILIGRTDNGYGSLEDTLYHVLVKIAGRRGLNMKIIFPE